MATHSSILAWRIPWTEEPHQPQSLGSHRVGQDWSDMARTHTQAEYTGLGTQSLQASMTRDQQKTNGVTILAKGEAGWLLHNGGKSRIGDGGGRPY